jgi:hypothetical protein
VGRMSVLVRPAQTARERPARSGRAATWLILAGYVLLAFGMTWRRWVDPASRVPTTDVGISDDVYLSSWSLHYVATALTQGHLPALVTTALNWPRGVNLMWNTSMLLPGIVLTPLTILAGPNASLAVLVTLGFAGSAAALFYVLRRWGVSIWAAALAGAIYGFSPAMRVAAEAHYHLQFAVLPPLIIDAALTLATGRKRTFGIARGTGTDEADGASEADGATAPSVGGISLRWLRSKWARNIYTGIWLGLLIAAQLFIAEELLVDTALAGLLMLIVLVICRPKAVPRRILPVAAGVGVAAVIVFAICGHALFVQFGGPLAEVGSPWHVSRYGNPPSDFVVAPDSMMLHGSNYLLFIQRTGQRIVEYFAYLGWPMLVVVLAAGIVCWRDLRARMAIVTFAVLELLSIGGHGAYLDGWHIQPKYLPWHYLQNLAVLADLLPNRISLLADGAAAVVLACAVDRAWAAARKAQDWRRPAIAGVAAAAIVAAIVPILPQTLATSSLPPVPPGWTQVLARLHLRPGDPVLELPIVNPAWSMEMIAVNDEPYSVVGGYCITPAANKHAAPCDTKLTLTSYQQTTLLRLKLLAYGYPVTNQPSHLTMLAAIEAWRPAAVVTAQGGNSELGRYLLGFFGRPTAHKGSVLAWRLRPGWQRRLPWRSAAAR